MRNPHLPALGVEPEDLPGVSPRRFHSVEDEAARLGVSKSWVYGEIREGRFPHRRARGRVLIDPAEVDEFLELTGVSAREATERAED